ncbi:MAG: hypothetical protein R3253_03515 [Longimicrobiales bacterium]|nr:hypothetical protein [Longimicrobiales bacterium]
MDALAKVLAERTDELAEIVRGRTGLTPTQSRRFVEVAADDLVAAFLWQAGHRSPLPMDSPQVARNVMEGVRGRLVAQRAGLPPRRAWEGLRALVPAVLRTAAREAATKA